MATWLQLTQQVFSNLDLPLETTGDIKTAVQTNLQLTFEQIINDYSPRELLVRTSAFSVTSATTSINLGVGGFAVTNLARIVGLGIDFLDTTPTEDEWIEEVSWITWKKQNNVAGGNTRRQLTWTFSNDDKFYLATLPTGSVTWNAYLYYQRTPTTFAEGSSPEIAAPHHRTIAVGATTYFPHFFQEDRRDLFLKFQREYNQGLKRLADESRSRQALKRIRNRDFRGQGGRVNWGDTIF